jgi:hypothetical protein
MKFDKNGMYITNSTKVAEKQMKIENKVNRDVKIIAKRLGIKPTPKIIVSHRKGQSGCYYIWKHIVKIGVKDGYHRTVLVHEMIHAKGITHHNGYRSNMKNDKLSYAIEKMIFDPKWCKENNVEINQNLDVVLSHKKYPKRPQHKTMINAKRAFDKGWRLTKNLKSQYKLPKTLRNDPEYDPKYEDGFGINEAKHLVNI